MNCQEVTSALVAYLEGEVAPSERTAVQTHLATCDACREELAAFSALQNRVRDSLRVRAARASVSVQAWSGLQARLAGENGSPGSPIRAVLERLLPRAGHRHPPVQAVSPASVPPETGGCPHPNPLPAGRGNDRPTKGLVPSLPAGRGNNRTTEGLVPSPRWERVRVRATSPVDFDSHKCQTLDDGPAAGQRRWMMTLTLRIPRWAPVALLILIAVATAFATIPPLRTAAQDPLGIFRVKRFATVTIDPANIPAAAGKGDPTSMGSLTVNQLPKTTTVSSIKEAQAMVDFGLRTPRKVPSGLDVSSRITVRKEGSFSYTFDLKKTREYLATLGLTVNDLPANLDGATVKLTIPSQVVVEYRAANGTGPSLLLSQGHSPVLEAPPGLDVDLLRRQLLSMPGLPTEVKSQLEAIQDWQQTAVIPLPKEGFTSKEVAVDGGMKGLYLQGKSGDGNGLLWEKSGIIYGVGGNVTPEQLLDAANSMSP